MSIEIVVLAAGEGRRMRSAVPKVLQRLGGRTLLEHVLETARALSPRRIHVVVGHGADAVRQAFSKAPDLAWVEQRQRLGTGHAARLALAHVSDGATVLILCADVPLVSEATLRGCVDAAGEGIGIVTMRPDDPAGFGRVVRDRRGAIEAVIEERDADSRQLGIGEVSAGILALPAGLACELVAGLDNGNAQGEYLLPDVVALAVGRGVAVTAFEASDPRELGGANDRVQLAELERYYQRRETRRLMEAGVGLRDPERVAIRGRIEAGIDCVLDVDVVLEGEVALGDRVEIGAGSVIRDSTIADDVVIEPHTVVDGAHVGPRCRLGPFARLRPGTELASDVLIGNFVETKQVRIGAGTKASHLAYLGDASLGAGCNVGAGTIICNYDGYEKHHTQIGDGVFIGSNSTLVAPVEIGDGAFVAAGSTVTSRVREQQLAVARARQRNISGWTPPAARESER